MRRKLVAGNWKMNGSLAANAALLEQLKIDCKDSRCDIAVCVPAPYLAQCQSLLGDSNIKLGAQDVSMHESGAYTGEVSAAMLLEFDCHYVIIGHSERRAYFAESDELVADKTVRALSAGLTPIVCVGETLEQREAGQTQAVISAQMDAVLAKVPHEKLAGMVLAYEPVWAIGTGRTATPEMAQEVHACLRQRIHAVNEEAAAAVRILYGGSMKPENAAELLAMPDIDGGLVGGAALKAADFFGIVCKS